MKCLKLLKVSLPFVAVCIAGAAPSVAAGTIEPLAASISPTVGDTPDGVELPTATSDEVGEA